MGDNGYSENDFSSSFLDELSPPPPSLQDEIDTLRHTLTWLESAFSETDSIDQRLRLSNSICHVSASLARLLRAQVYLLKHSPSPMDQAIQQALNDVLREWGRIE